MDPIFHSLDQTLIVEANFQLDCVIFTFRFVDIEYNKICVSPDRYSNRLNISVTFLPTPVPTTRILPMPRHFVLHFEWRYWSQLSTVLSCEHVYNISFIVVQ